jgi:hypothetical protein
MKNLINNLWENNDPDLQLTDEFEEELDQLFTELNIHHVDQFSDREMEALNGFVNRIAINRTKIRLIGEF